MTTSSFCVHEFPSVELLREVSDWAPANPFFTKAYMIASRRLGRRPIVFTEHMDRQLVWACPAFLHHGILSHALAVPSLQIGTTTNAFWVAVRSVCTKWRVSDLLFNTYASSGAVIPKLDGEVCRSQRSEYVVDVLDRHVWPSLSSNHQRNIKRARQAGLCLQRTFDPMACRDHVRLMGTSEGRRNGSRSSSNRCQQDRAVTRTMEIYLDTRLGELFQVVLNDEILASVMMLKAEKGAYYQSAGASERGVECGASHFLVHELLQTLHAEGRTTISLGGVAGENGGLRRFKSGFGARRIDLETVRYFVGSGLRKAIRNVASRLLGR